MLKELFKSKLLCKIKIEFSDLLLGKIKILVMGVTYMLYLQFSLYCI